MLRIFGQFFQYKLRVESPSIVRYTHNFGKICFSPHTEVEELFYRFAVEDKFAPFRHMVCLDVSQNRRKYKDIYFFTPRDDTAWAHKAQIVKPMPLFTCPTKTDAALVFRLIHVYNLCAILTQTHNFAHFFIIFFCKNQSASGLRNTRDRKTIDRNPRTLSFRLARFCTPVKRNSSHMYVHICVDLHSGSPYYNKNRKNTSPPHRINS